MQNDNELYHFGVLGMKWGKRKAQPISDLRSRYDRAKSAKKSASKTYSKNFNKAYNYDYYHPIKSQFTKKGQAQSKENWKKAINSAGNYNNANKAYKTVKKERKQALKSTYKNIQKNTKFGEKMLFSNSTRKLAAKYVVDNNMSMKDAKKKANKVAVRNTAIILTAIGGYALVKSGTAGKVASKVANTAAKHPVFKTQVLDANGRVIARKFASAVVN